MERLSVSAALESVVARFGGLVRSVGARHRLSEADVDEVLQELRIRLWRAFPDGEQIERVNASYVYRTAASASLDLLRRRRSKASLRTDSVDDRRDSLPDRREPHRELEGRELTERIVRALGEIPASRRPVVRMYLAGYSREEIARLLGWTDAKTRNLLYRGLADLRRRLGEAGITLDEGA